MPAPGFGYSAGDFIATIELIAKVVAAFKDSGGASTEYQQVVQELETLLQLLQHINTIKSTGDNLAHVNAIKGVALSIQAPLQKFLDKVTERYGSLDANQQKGHGMLGLCAGLSTVGRKVRWAVVMEKEIAKLRATVGTNVGSIFLLLNISHLAAASFIEKLAKKNQQALETGRAELQEELVSQRKKTKNHLLGQTDLINGVKADIKDLTTMSKINADRLGIIERQQNRDSAIIMHFLELIKSLAISLRNVFPMIYELLCRMILSNLQLYALLVSLQATISQMPTMLLSDNIHFEDVLGRTRSLPYQSFRYWKVFKAFLECEFEDLPGEQNVRQGQYHIVDAKFENLSIGEKEWDRKVFPGSRLNMSVIIESLRRRKGSCPVQRCFGKSKSCGGSSPFFVCSECGLKFTEPHQPVQATIVELENIPSITSKPPDRAEKGRGSPNQPKVLISQSNHSGKRGENNGDRLRRQAELRNMKAEMRKREVNEILNFKRIHISTIQSARAVPHDSKDDVEGDSKDKEANLSPLHRAARTGNAKLVQLLLEGGTDVMEKSGHEWTALHYAAADGHEQVMQLLLKNGADITARDRSGCVALHRGARNGHIQVVRLLLENGADIMTKQKNKWTALHLAASKGHEQVAQLLLENGADIMAEEVDRWTALHLAANKGHEQVVQLLLENGADITAKDKSGWVALHLAANKGHEQVVQLLLENGADITAKDKSGCVALHLAANKGHEQVVQLLLENGADIMTKQKNEWTALHLAANKGHEQVVQLLLEDGADIMTEGEDRWTALHLAANKGYEQVVQLLLENGADVTARDRYGWVALHQGARGGHIKVAQLLLEDGADTMTEGEDRWTALHLAAGKGHEQVVQLLLENGADITAKNTNGWTAVRLAASCGHKEVVSLLSREKGGSPGI